MMETASEMEAYVLEDILEVGIGFYNNAGYKEEPKKYEVPLEGKPVH